MLMEYGAAKHAHHGASAIGYHPDDWVSAKAEAKVTITQREDRRCRVDVELHCWVSLELGDDDELTLRGESMTMQGLREAEIIASDTLHQYALDAEKVLPQEIQPCLRKMLDRLEMDGYRLHYQIEAEAREAAEARDANHPESPDS